MKRNTIQHALVLDAVRKLQTHSTAEEIYALIASEHPSVSRGTVYRNLNALAAEGEILRVEVPGHADRFDFNCGSHYHVRCTVCGSCADLETDLRPDLRGHITDAHDFEITGYDIVFKGICPSCREKQQ